MRNKIPTTILLATVTTLTFSLLSPKWTFAAAAWIAPGLLIRFMQGFKIGKAFLFGWLILFASGIIANYKVMPFPMAFMIIISAQVSLVALSPYLLNRILATTFSRIFSTLIFPTAAVAIEYINSFQGSGTWGSISYSQVSNSPLIQLASITGIWGISFLIYWFNALINWVVNENFKWTSIRQGVIAFALIVTAVYVFGVARINPYFHDKTNSVRVAGITAVNLRPVVVMYKDAFGKDITINIESLTQTSPELQELNKALAEFVADPLNEKFSNTHLALTAQQDELFLQAKREAQAGAKIVSFSEALMFTVKPIEDRLLEKGKTFARENNVYLMLTMGSFLPGKIEFGTKYIENKALLIDPKGNLINTFFKNKPVPVVEGSVPGDGKIPVIKTPVGNLATSICYDADYPTLIRQASEQDADILILPSGDWKEVSPYHGDMARMRAIENGFSMFRMASGATSIACDYYGNILGSKNFYDQGEKALIAYLPTKRIKTIYTSIGDFFAWCCLASLILAMLYSLFSRRKKTMKL